MLILDGNRILVRKDKNKIQHNKTYINILS